MVEVLPRSKSFSNQIMVATKLASRHPQGSIPARAARRVFLFLSIVFAVVVPKLTPPPPRICGTLHGPSVTAPQHRLPDGRPVAYSEAGVPREQASYRLLVVHDYGGSRLDLFPCTAEKLEQLRVYMVSFDRAGYGESHPFPHRSVASEARDIEHLADVLKLGTKFHLITIGVGAYAAWGCLEHIPHRLAGVAMVAPVGNFWWPGIPSSVSKRAIERLSHAERNTLMVAHYTPWLLHWWTSQRWLASADMNKLSQSGKISEVAVQQGVVESILKDLAVQFGNWKIGLKRPESCSVHIWQGHDDPWFPSELQDWLKEKLPWIQHHVVNSEKHSLLLENGLPDQILGELFS